MPTPATATGSFAPKPSQTGTNANGMPEHIRSTNQILHVSTQSPPGATDTRIARFNSAVDMPVDITSAANVAADRIKFSGFASTARRAVVEWHGPPPSYQVTAGAGPIAFGALVAINSLDDATADARLTYTDLTGGGSSTAGVSGTFLVSPSNPRAEILLPEDTPIERIDAVGIPIGAAPTTILPAYLQIKVIG